jgi:hypothetical protein
MAEATTPTVQDQDLRARLAGAPGIAPEDTRTELMEAANEIGLRDRLKGAPGVAREDTRSELLEHEAQERAAKRDAKASYELYSTTTGMREFFATARAAGAAFYAADKTTRPAVIQTIDGKGAGVIADTRVETPPGGEPRYDHNFPADDRPGADEFRAGFAAAEREANANEAAKSDRKDIDPEAFRQEQEGVVRAWTPAQVATELKVDLEDYAVLLADVENGGEGAYYLREDMALRARVNPVYDAALRDADQALHQRVQNNASEDVVVDVAANLAKARSDASSQAERVPTQAAAPADPAAATAQAAELLRQRIERERALAAQGDNAVLVQPNGRELGKDEFIMPRRITQAYTEVDGKFFAKDSNRVMFEDKGSKIATSTTDKRAIEDMVAYARAKQWDSLKLTGSQEFRREAWLQAESQGIKTQGYTPKEADIAALGSLREARTTNTIVPLQERARERETPQTAAPRHDINKNQASLHVEATQNIARNVQALQQQGPMHEKTVDELTRLAYWRGVVQADNKALPKEAQDAAVAQFDKQAVDRQFLQRLDKGAPESVQHKTADRIQQRDTAEHTL